MLGSLVKIRKYVLAYNWTVIVKMLFYFEMNAPGKGLSSREASAGRRSCRDFALTTLPPSVWAEPQAPVSAHSAASVGTGSHPHTPGALGLRGTVRSGALGSLADLGAAPPWPGLPLLAVCSELCLAALPLPGVTQEAGQKPGPSPAHLGRVGLQVCGLSVSSARLPGSLAQGPISLQMARCSERAPNTGAVATWAWAQDTR